MQAHREAERPSPLPLPPVLPGGGWLGHVGALRRDPLRFLLSVGEQMGDISRFSMGPRRFVLLRHPEHLKYVLQDNYQNFSKQTRGYTALRKVLGNGLVTSEGAFWLRQRRIAQPAFHRQRIAHFAQTMVQLTEDMLQRWERQAQARQPLDVSAEMMTLTLRVVGWTLLSTEVSDEAPVVRRALGEMLHQVMHRTMSLVDLPLWVPAPDNVRLLYHRRHLDHIVLRMIQERRAGAQKNDLLSMLLEARDDETQTGMTDEQLRDEVMTLFLAGHETTANALSWTFLLLSQHPDCWAKLKAEVEEVVGSRRPTFQDLPRLQYCSQVLHESMRLYPPIWILTRRVVEDDVIGGFHIPKGNYVIVSPYVCHRNPQYFPRPEQFDPDRFSPQASPVPRFAFFPFSGGPRVCIGNSFALMEAQLVLASVVQRFRLALVPGTRVEPEPTLTLRPKYPLMMALHPAG